MSCVAAAAGHKFVICCWWFSGVEYAASFAMSSWKLYAFCTSVCRKHICFFDAVVHIDVLFSDTVYKFSYLLICVCAEVTVKQLKERIKELDEKLESSAQVLSSWHLSYLTCHSCVSGLKVTVSSPVSFCGGGLA